MSTIVYSARKIITMNAARPEATHVAVRDGRVLSVGSLEQVSAWGNFTLDERFKDKVLMPGLVEGHCHLKEGSMWDMLYLGWFDRSDPQGKVWRAACIQWTRSCSVWPRWMRSGWRRADRPMSP